MVSFDQIEDLISYAYRAGMPEMSLAKQESTRGALVRGLANHPLTRRYVAALTSTKNFCCTLPWHAQGERLTAAASVLSDEVALAGYTDNLFQETLKMRIGLSTTFLMAHVYLWSDEMRVAAFNMPVPRHVISKEQMAYPVMFFSFETAVNIAGGGGNQTNWWLVTHSLEGIKFHVDVINAESGLAEVQTFILKYGVTFPTDLPEESVLTSQQVLAMLAFINSPYIDDTLHPLPRTIRREIERTPNMPKGGIDEETNVVLLRRRYSSNGKGAESGEGPEWASRWWVSGHIRAQWYPSLKAHKLIFIGPYLKGPDDKPIKEKTYMVVR